MATPPSPPSAAATKPRRHGRRALLLLLAPLLLAAALVGMWQSLHTAAGTLWWWERLLPLLPGASTGTTSGALLGADARFRVERLALQFGGTRWRIDGLRLDGLQLSALRPTAPYVALTVRELGAHSLSVEAAPRAPDAPPAAAPTRLRLPVALAVDRVAVERLALPGLAAPLEGLRLRLASDGERHRADGLALRWQGLRVQGEAEVGADAPLPLQARLAADTDPTAEALPAWARGLTLALQAHGPLARFDTEGRLAMQDQQLMLRAQVAPFDRLPLPQLDARFEALDLARLLAPLRTPDAAPLPTTALSGSARVQLDPGQPLALHLQARNAAPGRWDGARLPLRDVDLLLRGRGGVWEIERAALQFAADERTPAGAVSASGRLEGVDGGLAAARGALKLQFDGLQPQLLDGRGPTLRLSGPIELNHEPAAPATPPARFGTLAFDAKLDGALLGTARARSPAPLRGAVRLAVRGRATPDGATLEALSASAGAARLDGRAVLARRGAGWHSEGKLTLERFDPSAWLPGDPAAAWRRGRNALDGRIAWDATLPGPVEGATLLRSLAGRLDAEFTDSHLAGQPLALTLAARAAAGRVDTRGELRAGGNRAVIDARLAAPGAPSAGEQLAIQVDAPTLERLAPLAELLGLGPLAGRAEGEARLDGALGAALFAGQLPRGALATRGRLRADGLRVGERRVDTASADWEVTLPGSAAAPTLANAALRGQAELRGLSLPGLRVPSATLQADGSLADHRATLRASLRAPAGAAPGQRADGTPAPEPAPLALEAALAGRWRAGEGSAPAVWQLRLPLLRLQPAPGSLGGTLEGLAARPAASAVDGEPPLRALLLVRDLAVEVRHAPGRWSVAAEPGAADLLGATLRWRAASYSAADGGAPQAELDADVEPLRVADWLQRVQPDFGWGGDLRVGARLSLRSQPDVRLRIDIERAGGDLQVTEFGVVQALGLSELRLALAADGGRWQATQAITGDNLGRITGRQSLSTDPRALWPGPDAAIDGEFGARVDNLGTWGAWVPAGWRLAGSLRAALRVAGRLGAPELIGEASGRGIGLRNALEGVALSDGELDARFEGDSARLGTLRFTAGDGSISVSGEARFGAEPQLELRLAAERATLVGRVDRRVVATGRATLRADRERITVEGSVRADEGLIDISRSDAPKLGDDVTVRRGGAPAPDAAAPAATARPAPREVDVDLALDLGQRFRLRGRGIDTRLGGELRLTTSRGRLAARGEIRTDSGTYDAYGQKLAIERGVITFVGPLDNPRLNIEAVRPNTDVRVGVTVGGSAQAPRVRLFSEPDLPSTEKLALLVTGRRYDSLGGADTLLLQRAAFALLAGDGSGEADFDLARTLQLDELSLRQSDGVVRDTVVTLGKQISERVYLGYERGLNATAGNWQLIYRIAQRFTLRAQSGDDSALDLIWLFRWN